MPPDTPAAQADAPMLVALEELLPSDSGIVRLFAKVDAIRSQLAAREAECARLAAERDALRRENERLRHDSAWESSELITATADRDRLAADNARLRAQVAGHAERIAAQSELLSRRAERQPNPQTHGNSEGI